MRIRPPGSQIDIAVQTTDGGCTASGARSLLVGALCALADCDASTAGTEDTRLCLVLVMVFCLGVGAGYDVQVTPGVEPDVFVGNDVTTLHRDVIGGSGVDAVAT